MRYTEAERRMFRAQTLRAATEAVLASVNAELLATKPVEGLDDELRAREAALRARVEEMYARRAQEWGQALSVQHKGATEEPKDA